jgi:hypothetical protein
VAHREGRSPGGAGRSPVREGRSPGHAGWSPGGAARLAVREGRSPNGERREPGRAARQPGREGCLAGRERRRPISEPRPPASSARASMPHAPLRDLRLADAIGSDRSGPAKLGRPTPRERSPLRCEPGPARTRETGLPGEPAPFPSDGNPLPNERTEGVALVGQGMRFVTAFGALSGRGIRLVTSRGVLVGMGMDPVTSRGSLVAKGMRVAMEPSALRGPETWLASERGSLVGDGMRLTIEPVALLGQGLRVVTGRRSHLAKSITQRESHGGKEERRRGQSSPWTHVPCPRPEQVP